MVQDDYKLGDSLNEVATYECCPATRSEMPWDEAATTINYDEVISNKIGNDDA